jgi:hypothetical protein
MLSGNVNKEVQESGDDSIVRRWLNVTFLVILECLAAYPSMVCEFINWFTFSLPKQFDDNFLSIFLSRIRSAVSLHSSAGDVLQLNDSGLRKFWFLSTTSKATASE